MFSKLDMDDERDRENDVSNLSTRPIVWKIYHKLTKKNWRGKSERAHKSNHERKKIDTTD